MYIYVRPVNLINMKHCSYLIVRVEYLMNVAHFLRDVFFNISVIFYGFFFSDGRDDPPAFYQTRSGGRVKLSIRHGY